MNRREVWIAACASGLVAALLLLWLRRFESERSGGPRIEVLVAKAAIARGEALSADNIATRRVPGDYVETRSLHGSDLKKVLGLRVAVPIEAQESLLWTDLAIAAEERRQLSSLVTPSYRGVYLRAIREDQGSSLIKPGDYVDVIATYRGADEKPSTSLALLQKLLVLANGTKTSSDEIAEETDDGKAPRRGPGEQGLTLSLNLPEAQLVAYAAEGAQFSVALRNPEDQRTYEAVPDVTHLGLTEGRDVPKVTKREAVALPVRLSEQSSRVGLEHAR